MEKNRGTLRSKADLKASMSSSLHLIFYLIFPGFATTFDTIGLVADVLVLLGILIVLVVVVLYVIYNRGSSKKTDNQLKESDKTVGIYEKDTFEMHHNPGYDSLTFGGGKNESTSTTPDNCNIYDSLDEKTSDIAKDSADESKDSGSGYANDDEEFTK